MHITTSEARPSNLNVLNNKTINISHENYNFSSGFEAYENLKTSNSDRYQYILPYYNFDSVYLKNF